MATKNFEEIQCSTRWVRRCARFALSMSYLPSSLLVNPLQARIFDHEILRTDAWPKSVCHDKTHHFWFAAPGNRSHSKYVLPTVSIRIWLNSHTRLSKRVAGTTEGPSASKVLYAIPFQNTCESDDSALHYNEDRPGV